jgi:photosystem II cytochrome c550
MRSVFRWVSILLLMVGVSLGSLLSPAAQAAPLEPADPYVLRYLQATEPVSLPLNSQGKFQSFTAADLSVGKRIFEDSCKNCHVGGATLPNPMVSLALEDLKGATPPRNTIEGLVAYQREPLTYDGQDFGFGCRDVPESWRPDEELKKLAAFILRAAEVAPGWGIDRFS